MVKVPKNEATMIQCICNSCSSYNECMRGEIMGVFCSTGDAGDCSVEAKECICSDCSVGKQFGLDGEMFCKSGSADMMK
ncbi:MAG: DUF2769 domain-containing protein [Methanobacteriaceae archaeon]|nr:DUF2769 domain-containing protein [Methanobacteriaceae archaeon]